MKTSEIVFGLVITACAVICFYAWYHVTFSDIIYMPETKVTASVILGIVGLAFSFGSYQSFENVTPKSNG